MCELEFAGSGMMDAPLHPEPQWFAIQTRAKNERKIASELQQKGIATFVPTVREVHRWSDRRKVVDVVLFSCYAFIQTKLSPRIHRCVLQTSGVLRWVGFNTGPCAIPDAQIEAVRLLVDKQVGCSVHPFLKAGQRVRVRGGCLEGLEGILVSRHDEKKFVVSIEPIQRSICISAENYTLELVKCSEDSARKSSEKNNSGADVFPHGHKSVPKGGMPKDPQQSTGPMRLKAGTMP